MASYIENLRFSDRNASDIGADDGLPPYNNDTFTTTYTETKACAIGKDGIRINYDLDTATPKYFEMTKDGVAWTDGITPYTTGLGRLAAVQTALASVELPPNSTTLKINDTVLVSAGITNQTTTINDGNITIQGTGLNNNPLLSLNTGTGNGVLYQECYNQRTAQTGEFNRMSFYAKNSSGTKTEYARIHQNAPAITAGAVKGRIDFSVGAGAGLQDYLSLNANTGQVDILNSTLHLNNNNISNVNTITTPIGNLYAKQVQPVFLNAHTNMTGNIEETARYNAFNAGRTPTWEQATSIMDFSGSVENISASQYGFNSVWWVGTTAGNVYYSNDSGNTWNFVYGFGGRINCFQTYNSNSSMMIGGQFTGTYNYIASIDTSLAITDPTGFAGLNSEVNCFYEDTAHSILHIGGNFTAFYGMSGTFLGFVAYSWGSASWYSLNNTTGAGFTGGAVKSITFDSGNNFIIVGGDFTDENTTGSNLGIPYIFTFQTPDGYSVSSFFSLGFSLNSNVSSVLMYSGEVMVGGQFNNSQGQGSCNTNYGFKMNWTGSYWNLTDYPIYSPQNPISSITYIASTGVYYTIENGNILYSGSNQLPNIPTGSTWNCIAYNGGSTYFATNNQTSVGFLFYILNNSLVITISSIGVSFFAYSGVYTICNLLGFGSSVEMMYHSGAWWVVSQNGCSFS